MVDGAEAAAAHEDTREAPKSLKRRLADIRDECSNIGKQDIQMGSFKIKGHTFEAVLAEIRPLFAKHGVDMTPNLVERTYSGNRCDVIVDFTFERTDDSDEQRVIRWAGAGTDNGDKAFSKAGTNAVKEMLKKRFLVTDREDAKEETETVEHKTDDGIARGEVERLKAERKAAIQQWATTFKAALETATTPDEIKRLRRDNRAQLDSDDLPDVTRTFFNDLINDRIAEMED